MNVEELLGYPQDSEIFQAFIHEMEGLIETYDLDDDPNDGSHWVIHRSGLQLIFDPFNCVSCIFLFAGDETYTQWKGPLPKGLSWGMTQQEVLSQLGQPHNRGGEGEEVWLRWEEETSSLHLQFVGTQILKRVTMIRSDQVP